MKNNISCIYKIVNNITGNYYVGSAINVYNRWNNHKSLLRRNIHPNIHLQRAWNKYGEDSFTIEIIEECVSDKKVILEREQFYLDTLKPVYNIAIKAEAPMYGMVGSLNPFYGKTHSEAVKKRLSENASKRICSKETIEKCKQRTGEKNGMFGKHHTEETKKKISKANTGKIRTEEMKEKWSKLTAGEKNGNAKITSEQAKEIKKLLKNNMTPTDISKVLNINRSIIYDISYNRTWKEV